MRSWRRRAALAGTLALAGLTAGAGPAAAATTGEVDRAFAEKGVINVVVSAAEDGTSVEIDPASVKARVTVGTQTQTLPPVTRATSAEGRTTRTAVLVLDTSESMDAPRLSAAKNAAETYLESLPDDVAVGLVTFGDPARKQIDPVQDHARVTSAIRGLKAAGDTAMFQAVTIAAGMFGAAENRSIVLLTDGKNDDKGKRVDAAAAKKAIDDSKAKVTAVTVGDEGLSDLQKIIPEDQIVTAQDAGLQTALRETFQNESDALTNQLYFSVELPGAWAAAKNGELTVEAATVDGTPITFEPGAFFARAPAAPKPTALAAPEVVKADPRLTAVNTPVVVIAIIGLFGALCIMIATATGALVRRSDEESEVVRRISVYTFSGRETRRAAVAEQTTALGNSPFARGAVELAERLARNRNLERSLDGRLDAAGLPLRTAEWTVIHIASAVGTALLLLLISGGLIVAGVIGLLIGLIAPWLFLSVRQSRRESKFLGQLPDTLQLLAGSLQAGYSLPQAMDTVVREAKPPIGTEFNRALIEARLGVPPEDALEGIATRTRSRDFSWIVMAIRIQRDIGGNLAELLGTVAETLRERERLRRQVSALSAEGRLSGIILAGLPLVFTLYLLVVQPTYLRPMYTTAAGLMMLVIGGILLVIGAIWMSRVVKVRV